MLSRTRHSSAARRTISSVLEKVLVPKTRAQYELAKTVSRAAQFWPYEWHMCHRLKSQINERQQNDSRGRTIRVYGVTRLMPNVMVVT